MKNNFLITALLVLFAGSAFGQLFTSPVEVFSKKKPSYLSLKSGEEVEGNIKTYKIKKGLIKEITLKVDGKKVTYTADQISSMYLPQSNLDKLGKAMDRMYDATQWDDEGDINAEYLKDGYAYFEQATVQLKKKKIDALLQMMNASFSNPVKIFHDPWSRETASASVGGIQVAGGLEKSYWVRVGDDVCFKLKKKDYPEALDKVFSKCDSYKSEIPAKPKWADFPELLLNYSKSCRN